MADDQPMRAPWGDIAQRLTEITDTVLFDDVWRRPGLSPRDRSLITVASLVTAYRQNELPFHLKKALGNGVTRDEIREVLLQTAIYCGAPAALDSVRVAQQIFMEIDAQGGAGEK